jgi:hypothetical protein
MESGVKTIGDTSEAIALISVFKGLNAFCLESTLSATDNFSEEIGVHTHEIEDISCTDNTGTGIPSRRINRVSPFAIFSVDWNFT